MKKTHRRLALHRESLRNLTAVEVKGGVGTRPSIDVGCTTEYTWYCPSASGCTNCPICNEA
jgi:hypothetical protein